MISLNELWIGDLIRLKKSGRIGKYEGIGTAGKARINVGDKIILAVPHNMERYTPPPPKKLPLFDDDPKTVKASTLDVNHHSRNQIDLHIDILAPHLANELPVRIIEYQLEAFKIFVSDSHERKRSVITIIHGKGEGVLKNHIHVFLKSDPRVKFFSETNRGGATEVWLNY